MIPTTGCDLDPLLVIETKQLTCKDSNKNRISYIKGNSKEGDILFTGVTKTTLTPWSNPATFDKFFQESIEKIAEIARGKNVNIVFHTPIPRWERLNTRDNQLCQDGYENEWFRPKGTINCSAYSEIDRNVYEKKEKETLDILKKIETTYPNFHVFPIHEFLCDHNSDYYGDFFIVSHFPRRFF